jgi:hypothetical protein
MAMTSLTIKAEWAAASFPSIITIRRFIFFSVSLRGLSGINRAFVSSAGMIGSHFLSGKLCDHRRHFRFSAGLNFHDTNRTARATIM